MRILAVLVLSFSLLAASDNVPPMAHPRQQEPHWKAKIEERHPTGQPSKIIFFEEIGDAEAVAVKLITYYPSGQVKLESDVTSRKDEEGKLKLVPVGVEITLDERNNVEKVAHYNNEGDLHGEMRLFYPTGQEKAVLRFNQGKRQGLFVTYHLEGGKAEEVQYEDDKVVGDLIRYYPKGGKAAQISYLAGIPHGKATEWYENGALKTVRNFENGLLDSDGKNPAMVMYSEDHIMIEVQDHRRGEPIGTHVKYHPNGKESHKLTFKEGKKEGKELFILPMENWPVKANIEQAFL